MRRSTMCRWLAALALPCAAAAGTAGADSFVVPATLDFSVRDEGRDGFDQVLEGECCIRATIFTSFRIRGVAEFDLASLPPGLVITSATLRLVLVSGTGDNPADFYAYAADGMATAADAERTDILLAENLQIVVSPVDFGGAALNSLVQSRYQEAGSVGMVFKLTREHELSFRDLEFAANDGSPSNSARLLIEALPAPPPPEVSPPGAAVPFTVAMAGPGTLALAWEATPGADSYRLVVGDLLSLIPSGGVTELNAATMMCGIPSVTTTISEPAGSVFLLVAGDNTGGVGPLGSGTAGPRSADLACP